MATTTIDAKDESPARLQNRHRTDAWGNKFPYGAYTTTISSMFLAKMHPDIIVNLADPKKHWEELGKRLPVIRQQFLNLSEEAIDQFLKEVREQKTPTVFNSWRDFCLTDEQNQLFIEAMAIEGNKKQFMPVDKLYPWDLRFPWQLNTHRGLYQNSCLIPQNSVAAVFNAYIAGIRNSEFDVLESKDFVNVVIHDLVTNRLDVSYDAPPKYVALWPWKDLEPTEIKIMDPLGEAPDGTSTGINRLCPTEDMLLAIRKFMPEMTVYLDSRNHSPVSLLKLLYDNELLRPGVIGKIYPFELGGGVYDIVKAYADRYTEKNSESAVKQLRTARLPMLLATNGLPTQALERSARSQEYKLSSSYAWDIKTEEGEPLLKVLPFSPFNETSPYNAIFDKKKTDEIVARTALFTRWVTDMSSICEIAVLQMGLTPSLVYLVDHELNKELEDIPAADKLISAINDNFLTIYSLVMSDKLKITVPVSDSETKSLRELWNRMSFGTSDRYPDFAFALRGENGEVIQETLKNFYYFMDGTVYYKDDYAIRLTRSTEAVKKQAARWEPVPSPTQKAIYLTTDLPTDLRTMWMGLSGKEGFPQWMDYRAGGVVKEKANPKHYINWKPRKWSTEMFGKLRAQDPEEFAKLYNSIKDKVQKVRDPIRAALSALEANQAAPLVVVNARLLEELQETKGYFEGKIPAEKAEEIAKRLLEQLQKVEFEIKEQEKVFAEKYKVNWDGLPTDVEGTGPFIEELGPMREIPQADWDQ